MGPLFAFGVVTFRRRDVVSQTLPHLRAQFPHVPIYVADQNGDKDNLELYEKVGAEVLWLDFDAGLSKARNELMRSIEKDYVFLIDDDDVIAGGWDQSFIDELCGLLEQNADWIVISGALKGRKTKHKRFEFQSDDESSLMLVDSADEVKVSFRGRDVSLVEADYVLNFGLFSRIRLLERGFRWDEELKIMEHLDFFLGIWRANRTGVQARVFFFSELEGQQIARTSDGTYADFRQRRDFSNIVARKWGIRYVVHGSSGNSRTLLSRDESWREALSRVSTILDSLNLKWWVSNGTLLGLVREGHFLAHDTDMDITLQVRPEQLRELETRVRTAGFRIARCWGRPGAGLEWALFFVEPGSNESPFRHPKIDFFFADEVALGIVTSRYRGPHVQKSFYPHFDVETLFVDNWKCAVKVPVNAEKVLENEYGSGWREPSTTWDYFVSPNNIYGPMARVNYMEGLFYRSGLYLRSSTPRFFISRHPKLAWLWRKAVWVKKLPGRTIAYVIRRIKRFDVAIFLLSVRYYIKFWSPKMRKSGSDGDPSTPVFWINLPKNTERSSRVRHQFELLEIKDAQRFDGVPSENRALGCALAHIHVLRNYPNGAAAIMVCEDDVEFLVSRIYLDTVLKEFFANPALSVLCLGLNSSGRALDVSKNLSTSRGIQTTSCYVVKAEAVHLLLKSFVESAEKLERGAPEGTWAIDQHWKKLQGRKLLFAIPKIRVAKQAPGFSDVQREWVNYGV